MKYIYKSETYSIPQRLLFIPLKEAVIFPYVVAPLFFQSEEALTLLNKVILENSLIGCVGLRDSHLKDPQPRDLLSVGTVCKILQLVKLPNKGMKIFVEGLSRVHLQNITHEKPSFKADIKEANDHPEREIVTLCRKIAKELAMRDTSKEVIDEAAVEALLGPRKYFREVAQEKDRIGVATGLAWTENGGDILFIETSKMKGDKGLILTGSLGEVMKESAQAALSYIRTNALSLHIPENFYQECDIHIHIPAGATPKDGPSAGITIATAVLSLLREKPFPHEIAMTGEMTLSGMVLPVGGIKEKILAARRAGVKTVILPRMNERNLEDIPDYIRKELNFVFVEHIQEVLDLTLPS